MAKRIIEVAPLRAAHVGIDRGGEVYVHFTGRKPANPKRKEVKIVERPVASRARASGCTHTLREARIQKLKELGLGFSDLGYSRDREIENSWKVHRKNRWRRHQNINARWDMAA